MPSVPPFAAGRVLVALAGDVLMEVRRDAVRTRGQAAQVLDVRALADQGVPGAADRLAEDDPGDGGDEGLQRHRADVRAGPQPVMVPPVSYHAGGFPSE